jgi:hypothetical protein
MKKSSLLPRDYQHPILSLNIGIDPAKRAIAATKNKEVRRIARVFKENCYNAQCPMTLPFYFLMVGRIEVEHLLAFTDVYLPYANRGESYESKRDEIDQKVAEEFLNRTARKKRFNSELAKWSKDQLNRTIRSQKVTIWLDCTIKSIITASWTAFEVLSGDLWRNALNSEPQLITTKRMQAALTRRDNQKNSSHDLTGRSVNLGLVAKHGFDLRNCLGSLLIERFSLNSMEKIEQAYYDIFGEVPELKQIFKDKHLLMLEETRHLIVHRGGIVDRKYNDRFQKQFELHEYLPLEKMPLVEMINSSVNCGAALVKFMDKHANTRKSVASAP